MYKYLYFIDTAVQYFEIIALLIIYTSKCLNLIIPLLHATSEIDDVNTFFIDKYHKNSLKKIPLLLIYGYTYL